MKEHLTETLTGTVEDIVFRNEETGFTVLDLAVNDELVTVVGEALDIQAGEELTVTGYYTAHATYGTQFKGELFERRLPATANAIGRYLASRAIKGVGPALARRMVDRFGDKTLEVIEKNPQLLTAVHGISPRKAEQIHEEYQRLFGIRTVMLFLSSLGLDPASGIRVWKLWGNLAPDTIRDNPYCLCHKMVDVPFEKADEIAAQLGVEPQAPVRVRAGLQYVLRTNSQSGHTCLPQDRLCPITAAYLEQPVELVEEILEEELEDRSLYRLSTDRGNFIYLPGFFDAEQAIAARALLMVQSDCPQPRDYSPAIRLLEEEQGIQYASLQRRAIQLAMNSHLFILTGGPGTGKTTTLNGILALLEQEGLRVSLAAPTGRAAKRMTEVTGREAKTIHRLLEVDPQSVLLTFKRNEKNLLPCDAVIVDEMSMVDTLLMDALLRAVKMTCKVILVGDPDQLPSVGAGNLLGDLIASGIVPTIHLDQVFRQAAQSLIVTNAHAIVRGELPVLDRRDSDFFFLGRGEQSAAATVVELCQTRLPRSYGYSPLWDIQVIVPGRKGLLGTEQLNQQLQAALNPPAVQKVEVKDGPRLFREGDKVMQIKNNYDIVWKSSDGEGTGIFNGDIGVIQVIDRPSKTMIVQYDDRRATYTLEMLDQLEHAYAITVHKSQGSEFEAVVMPLAGHHPRLHYRTLLYTGVTRARKLLVMLGQPATVAAMVANNRRTRRYTQLVWLLTHPQAGEAVFLQGEEPSLPPPSAVPLPAFDGEDQ